MEREMASDTYRPRERNKAGQAFGKKA